MCNIVDLCNSSKLRPIFICDFSPPRSGDFTKLEPSKYLCADVISVAYSPGKSPTPDTLATSIWIEQNTKSKSLVTVTTRDMNKLAIQNKLLGAEMWGLKNILAIQGDKFTKTESLMLKTVNDYTPTSLLRDITKMNQGLDFEGNNLKISTNLCPGTSLDINRDSNTEISLTRKKLISGSKFFVTQPVFETNKVLDFKKIYSEKYGNEEIQNIFWGVQILASKNFSFAKIPLNLTNDLSKGRSGIDIAIEQINSLLFHKMRLIYLIPPIFPNGTRDYDSAQAIIELFKQ